MNYVCRKAVDAFYKIGRLAKANWGLGYKEIMTIYHGIGESILLYGAAAWAHRIDLAHTRIFWLERREQCL